MYAAISGLKAHMSKLNVIGNNVANVNTYGYKTGRTVFETALYTTMRGGSDGTNLVGGRNPAQIGYGAQISTIDLNMTGGDYSPTGRPMDCMIKGDGFLMVGDKNATINPDDPNSLKSLDLTRVGDLGFDADGYLVDGNGQVVYGFLQVDDNSISDHLVPIRLPRVDGDGKLVYPKQEGDDPLTDKGEGFVDDEGNPFKRAILDSISINEKTGKISGFVQDSDEPVTIGYIALAQVTNPGGVTQLGGRYYKAGDGSGDMTVSLMGGVGAEIGIDHVNGSDLAGMLIGSTSTSLITGGLEGSKTDLATEISEMITTQRGYQANTRIITVTDAMLEELVNIKR